MTYPASFAKPCGLPWWKGGGSLGIRRQIRTKNPAPKGAWLVSVVGRIMVPKDAPILIPGTCDCVRLLAEGN